MEIKYIDAHAHIHSDEYDTDREEVIARMKEAGVGVILVGTHLADSKTAVEMAEAHDNMWATIGIHPTDTTEIFKKEDFEELVKSKRVVAIGECGLDYFHEENIEGREKQKENFIRQAEFAVEINKPLMVHCRPSKDSSDAHEDLIEIIKKLQKTHGKKVRGNIHFFTGEEEIAQKYFELGFTVSIPGVVTFARDVAKTVSKLPLDKILSETDCPFATPVPHRGKRNEPVFVIDTVKKIAELQKQPVEEVVQQLLANTRRIFNL